MENVAGYLIRVTAAAIFCAIIKAISGKNGTVGAVIRLLTGLFLAVSVVSPLATRSVGSMDAFLDGFSMDASFAAEEGSAMSDNMRRKGIKEGLEAYILDKAMDHGAQIQVEVTLSEDDPPLPCTALISGNISPLEKSELSRILEKDLGIPKEAQLWIG